MSKIYLKKTYNSDGDENYQFVKKYCWGLITRPICFNIVKKVYCDIYEVYVTPVIFKNIETAKKIGSYFIGNKTINIDDNTSIEVKDGWAELENQLVRPAIWSFDVGYEKKVAYVNCVNDIWWWLPQHPADDYYSCCRLDIKFRFLYSVKYCCKLDDLINTIININKQKDVEFIPFEI